MQLCLHIFRSRFSFFAHGWHSQRESKFLSRITGAEFAIPWAYSLFSIVFVFFFSFLLFSLQSSRPMYHQWELTPNFDPTSPTDRAVTWIRHDGSSAQGMVNNAHITQELSSEACATSAATELYTDLNCLKNFISAFPG